MSSISTPDGDLIANAFRIAEDEEALRQRCIQRARLWRGEWFLDTSVGVPYIEEVVRVRPEGLAAGIVATEVQRVEGVQSVTDLRMEQIADPDPEDPQRRWRISFTVNENVPVDAITA